MEEFLPNLRQVIVQEVAMSVLMPQRVQSTISNLETSHHNIDQTTAPTKIHSRNTIIDRASPLSMKVHDLLLRLALVT